VDRNLVTVPPRARKTSADDIEAQLLEAEERPSRVHAEPLPAPPRPPSMAAERVRAWGPILTGLAAIITAAATLVAAFSGVFKTDLAPLRLELQAISTKLDTLAEKQLKTQRRVGDHERDHKTRETNARAIREIIDSYKREQTRR
jgi:hypothetical protein